jgi:hypothetical protein
MRLKGRLFGAGLMVAATMLVAAPAHAAKTCVGTQQTLALCVDPTGFTYYEDCVYLASSTCTPVVVRGPSAWCEGALSPNCQPFQ